MPLAPWVGLVMMVLAVPQPPGGVSYAAKIGRAEATIDWRRPAADIERAIRAFDPFPGAVSVLRDTAIKFWSASVVDCCSTSPAPTSRATARSSSAWACAAEGCRGKPGTGVP